MTRFIDLIYCAGMNGLKILAYVPINEFIKKGDIVSIDEMTGFYLVICKVTVTKDSDTYKFITEVLGEPNKVTDRYSHREVEDSEDD